MLHAVQPSKTTMFRHVSTELLPFGAWGRLQLQAPTRGARLGHSFESMRHLRTGLAMLMHALNVFSTKAANERRKLPSQLQVQHQASHRMSMPVLAASCSLT